MPNLGTWKSPFPLRLGGKGNRLVGDLYATMQSGRPTVLKSATGEVDAENMVIARIAACGYRTAQRRVVQRDPARLSTLRRTYVDPTLGTVTLSMLERWEQILLIVPTADASDFDRRAAVAARVRSVVGNSLAGVTAAAQLILGSWFVSLSSPNIADVIAGNASSLWPGGANTANRPGQPASVARPWSSGIAKVTLFYTAPASASPALVTRRVNATRDMLDGLLPAWATFDVLPITSAGRGFIVGVSQLGVTPL